MKDIELILNEKSLSYCHIYFMTFCQPLSQLAKKKFETANHQMLLTFYTIIQFKSKGPVIFESFILASIDSI